MAEPAPSTTKIDPAGVAFFESKIRPLLVEHCYRCHSADAQEKRKLKAGLYLDTRAGTLAGGENGPALVVGKPGESKLIQALKWQNDLEMPPAEPLPASVVADFEKWVAMGAPDPRDGAIPSVVRTGPIDINAGKGYWAFVPPKKASVPAVKNAVWPRSDIDRYTLSTMEHKGVTPVADADPLILLRRITFDLTGLPPTPAEIEAFNTEASRDAGKAIEVVVDRLLASPGFGERWGRHWLDVARFAESRGDAKANNVWPDAWKYRDWVISAVNRDMPYNRFVAMQIAGDLLPPAAGESPDEGKVATGFLVVGNKAGTAFDQLEEQVGAMSVATMALTVQCARCHDHKFDPIPTADYYALAGILINTKQEEGIVPGKKAEPAPINPDGMMFVSDAVKASVAKGVDKKGKPVNNNKVNNPTKLAALTPSGNLRIQEGGDDKRLGEESPRGLLKVLADEHTPAIPPAESGRRQLAESLASPSHPLTARVMANRVWYHLMGRGIVATVDNFGELGDRPTHPELLDHLAVTFMDDGWSVKKLVRRIVLSRTYQLSIASNEANRKVDPDNRLLWQHRLRRLDAESLRDAVLTASGSLDRSQPGGSLIAALGATPGNKTGAAVVAANMHRSVYQPVLRGNVPELLEAFDFPDPSLPAGRRDTSVVPTQALLFMNHPFVMEHAEKTARDVMGQSADDSARLNRAYVLTIGRLPDAAESARDLAFVQQFKQIGVGAEQAPVDPSKLSKAELKALAQKKQQKQQQQQKQGKGTSLQVLAPELNAWATLCHSLLASAEFRFVQ
ncbi:PSD1 and planctomycete cytochrome C domain-containing protein [Humisphaera borealis]|uniref:PSD1 domain-containing protein n=1 Tax=Humisphaera borealis TaxID=2807512 RepID=A0A7M2WXM6_9BACT|nr:PSD1 and planctomycete cytochrome C domain-containing protein [Humisphaera borealis]QOV89962.1 PSD1 domain-containing protein [Humisphaera borealis]